jgi:hypothetical protein
LRAKELPISESCLRNWMAQADANGGETARSTSAEKKELAELRRRNRQLEIRVDVLLSVAASAARACTPDPSGRTTIRHPADAARRWHTRCPRRHRRPTPQRAAHPPAAITGPNGPQRTRTGSLLGLPEVALFRHRGPGAADAAAHAGDGAVRGVDMGVDAVVQEPAAIVAKAATSVRT